MRSVHLLALCGLTLRELAMAADREKRATIREIQKTSGDVPADQPAIAS